MKVTDSQYLQRVSVEFGPDEVEAFTKQYEATEWRMEYIGPILGRGKKHGTRRATLTRRLSAAEVRNLTKKS